MKINLRKSGREKRVRGPLIPGKDQLEAFMERLERYDMIHNGDFFFCLTSVSKWPWCFASGLYMKETVL